MLYGTVINQLRVRIKRRRLPPSSRMRAARHVVSTAARARRYRSEQSTDGEPGQGAVTAGQHRGG